MENVLNEGVSADLIHLTGNTVIDAFHAVEAMPGESAIPDLMRFAEPNRRLVLVTMHRRENHGAAIAEICRGLRRLAGEFPDIRLVLPLHMNPNVRGAVERELGAVANVMLVPPLAYGDLVRALRKAFFVVTDSGGLQEEAVGLGKPVLVLRETTERQEGIEAGLAQLVGSDSRLLIAWARRLLTDPELYARMAAKRNLYGDGHAAERIVSILQRHDPEHLAAAGCAAETGTTAGTPR